MIRFANGMDSFGIGDGWVLDGERFDIKAKVHQLTWYSAHADQKELLAWVASMPERSGRIKLVHGEIRAREAMRMALDDSLRDWDG